MAKLTLGLVGLLLVLAGSFFFGWRPLCICVFSGDSGRLRVDPSCTGQVSLWVIPEDDITPAFSPVRAGTWYLADGFKIGDTIYKVDGSTYATIRCRTKEAFSIDGRVNLAARWFWDKKAPYAVPAGQFDNEPPPRVPAQPVQ